MELLQYVFKTSHKLFVHIVDKHLVILAYVAIGFKTSVHEILIFYSRFCFPFYEPISCSQEIGVVM